MASDPVIANQEKILANQMKLDKVLVNQERILNNQEKILANQVKLDKVLVNQEKMLVHK